MLNTFILFCIKGFEEKNKLLLQVNQVKFYEIPCSSFCRLGITFRNAPPVQIVGEFLFHTDGNLFGMNSKYTTPITSAFSCIQESVQDPIFQVSFVRTLSLKIPGPYFHFTQAHTQRGFPAPFSKLFLRYVVLVTARDFTKPWITVS